MDHDTMTRVHGPGRMLSVLLPLLLALHGLSGALILPTLPLLPASSAGAFRDWAFSSLILGFGATQIMWGSMADEYGRRRVLLIGLSLFVLASTGCVFVVGTPGLIACRLVQGAGIAAAGVCARAIIRDTCTAQQTVAVLARNFSWTSAVSLVGPFAGSALVLHYGAAGALTAYCLLGLMALLIAVFGLRETRPRDMAGDAQWTVFSWREIRCHPVFRAYAILTACSYVGHYLFLNNSSLLLIEQCGLSTVEYGAVLSSCSLFHLLGTFLCRRLLAPLGVRNTVCLASLIGLAGGGLMCFLALSGLRSATAFVAPYFLYILAHAMHQSCGQAAAMSPFKAAAGRASGLLGTALPVAAVSIGLLLTRSIGNSPLVLPTAICTAAALTACCAWTLVRRRGDISTY